jgi:DNA-binding NarL/FixJ family response regulator/tRNA A-37 threonylcarbamoyl transferase component Bud32
MTIKKRILIVDDEPINRLGLRILLNQSEELEVVAEASNGAEAIEQVKSCRPDLILMDVKMPIMNGVEAATRIRQDDPNVKIIMLSSVNTEREVLGAITAGASGYCIKESNPERLFTAIKAVQEGDLWLDSAIASLILGNLHKGAKSPALAAPLNDLENDGHQTDKYAVMSGEELKLLGLMVEGHSHEKLAQLSRISSDRLRIMQIEIMNKIAVIQSTKVPVVSLGEPTIEPKMECPICNDLFEDTYAKCPHHGVNLVPHERDPFIGTTFADRFEIQSLIGQGSGGAVYKARHKFMNRMLAIKIMHVGLMTDLSLVQRFRQEAEAASLLDHPNIVSVLDFGLSQEGYAYMVMDMLDGPSLMDLLHKVGHLTTDAAVPIFVQCSDGLGHAHSKGIIHRDFKPSNVILVTDADGDVQAKIVDFGIVKMLRRAGETIPDITVRGEVFGSPTYMSPEQCAGLAVTSVSDIYSLGVSIYESLTGAAPFSAESMPELMYKHIREPAVPLRDFSSSISISKDLSDMVMKCLEKEPHNRFQTMQQVKEALLSTVATSKL